MHRKRRARHARRARTRRTRRAHRKGRDTQENVLHKQITQARLTGRLRTHLPHTSSLFVRDKDKLTIDQVGNRIIKDVNIEAKNGISSNYLHVGVDPGVTPLFAPYACSAGAGKMVSARYQPPMLYRGRYVEECGFTRATIKREKRLKKLLDELSPEEKKEFEMAQAISLRVMNLAELTKAVEIKSNKHQLLKSINGHHHHLHSRWLTRRCKKSCIDRYVDEVALNMAAMKKAYSSPSSSSSSSSSIMHSPDAEELSKTIIWHVGAAQFRTTRSGFNGVARKDVLRSMTRYGTVILINEYLTSKICPWMECQHESTFARMKKGDTKGNYKLFRCNESKYLGCHTIHRDRGSAFAIANVGVCIMDTGVRPTKYTNIVGSDD